MIFRIKNGVRLEDLRKYGFELGKILKNQSPYKELLEGCSYKDDWWLYFYIPVDEDTGEYLYDDNTERVSTPVSAWVDTRGNKNILWFDAIPECTYHIGMDELNPMVDIIFRLVSDGILEKVDDSL